MPRPTKKKSSRKVSFKVRRKTPQKSSVKKKTFKKSSSKKTASKPKPKSYSKNIPSALRNAARGVMYGHKFGSSMGPYGAALGASLGGVAGGAYGLITGHGDYSVSSNSLTNQGQQIPSFDSNGRHCVRVKHREYVGDITGTTEPFAVTAYSFNPGNRVLFPWLASIALNFEEYKWEGAIVELRSISGVSVGSTNEALGFQALGAEYNATLPPYNSKLQLENAEFSVSGPPSANVLLPIECKRSETAIGELYVNGGGIPTGQDARLYDHCLLNVAAGNQQAAYKISELWISYDVCLYKPKFGYSTNSVAECHIASALGVTTSAFFGSTRTIALNSTFVPTLTGTTITFPRDIPLGIYQLYYTVVGAYTLTAVGPTISYTSGCEPVDMLQANTTDQLNTFGNASTAAYVQTTAFFRITSPEAILTLSVPSGNFISTVTAMDCIISLVNSRIST